MALPIEDYTAQVTAARRISRWVGIFAAISWSTGWLVIIACLVAWLAFGASLIDSLEIILVIGVAGVIGGDGLYATSRSLGIAASRLEIDIATKLSAS
ncbi:MAG: hypothetical protein ACO20A_09325 [Candidatus Nanopelagicales bacterium]